MMDRMVATLTWLLPDGFRPLLCYDFVQRMPI